MANHQDAMDYCDAYRLLLPLADAYLGGSHPSVEAVEAARFFLRLVQNGASVSEALTRLRTRPR